jgi:hypothetical protein
VAAGACTELAVLNVNQAELRWLVPVLVALVAVAGYVLVTGGSRARLAALGVSLALLLVAPATWSVQTLGHAANGTFPAGGPATAGFGGGPGGRLGPPPGAMRGPGGPSGPFGSSENLTTVLSYVKAHGGGTLGVSSQTSAEPSLIGSNANVAGLGGFSGRESAVSVGWLADAVAHERIRWVLTDGSGGSFGRMRNDTRVGSTKLMSAIAATCTKVPSSAYAGSSTGAQLYDCSGHSAVLSAYGTG